MSSDNNSDSDDGGDNPIGALKQDRLYRLLQVQSAGSFSTFGICETFAFPGLFVQGVGEVQLPLSQQDAQSLISRSRFAPFGKGDKTIIDASVRRTWEIDAAEVEFRNEAWSKFLSGTVEKVALELGTPNKSRNVRAELYKMLLYEEGAMFKPHKE